MIAKPAAINLHPNTQARLERLAKAQQRSIDLIMREAVEQYIQLEEAQEQFRQDALTAWADFQATGLHLTSEEVDAWLAKLEVGDDVPAPEFHA